MIAHAGCGAERPRWTKAQWALRITGLAHYHEIEITDGFRWEATALYTPEAEWKLSESREIT
ncbi:MAG: hypothetical protein ABGW84_03570 [Sphingomonadaceae bacterium]|jgi:hypothetical protein